MFSARTVQLDIQLTKQLLCPFVLHVKESEYSEIMEGREGKERGKECPWSHY